MKGFIRTVAKAILPRTLYYGIIRNLKYTLPDLAQKMMGNSKALTPPGRLIFTGGTPEIFKEGGEEFFEYFKSFGELKPDEKVLDIGSGIGRMALPLTHYLSANGGYEGFDIVPMGTQWCKDNITPKFPNFAFSLADIYNKEYNPKGELKAKDFKFPYADNTFDFAFATSVFTHMFLEDIEHYLSETARVLKPNGRCLLTFFLMNVESEELIKAGKSTLNFQHQMNDIFVVDKKVPEEAVCVPETMLKNIYKKHGIEILSPIHYGAWCGRQKYITGQDFIVGKKL